MNMHSKKKRPNYNQAEPGALAPFNFEVLIHDEASGCAGFKGTHVKHRQQSANQCSTLSLGSTQVNDPISIVERCMKLSLLPQLQNKVSFDYPPH